VADGAASIEQNVMSMAPRPAAEDRQVFGHQSLSSDRYNGLAA
jgi:hypothetical protein